MGERIDETEGAYQPDGPPTLRGEVLGRPKAITLTIDVKYMRETHTTSVFLIAIFLLGPCLTPGQFLKDGDFSSIPSTYD